MKFTNKVSAIAIGLVLITLSAVPARAQAAAALVLERSGRVVPKVEPYTELAATASVVVSKGAKLVFLDYETCMRVTVTKGHVTFGPQGYKVAGGHETHRRVACPSRVRLQNSSEVAAGYERTPPPKVAGGHETHQTVAQPSRVRLRNSSEVAAGYMRGAGDNQDLTLASRPRLILVGKNANLFARIEIQRNHQTLLSSSLTNRHFVWPANRNSLRPGANYRLVLVPRGTEANPVGISFDVVTRLAGPDHLVLIDAN